MTLQKLAIGVKPKTDHPFKEWSWGWLIFWICAEDYESAKHKAQAIAEMLPYELSELGFIPGNFQIYQPGDRRFEALKSAEINAARVGLMVMLDCGKPGAEEPPGLFFLQ